MSVDAVLSFFLYLVLVLSVKTVRRCCELYMLVTLFLSHVLAGGATTIGIVQRYM